ncbi:unnamed protein product [Lota lota]
MAQLDLSLSDALSDAVAQPGQEARVERDFVAQLESEAFDDQIGETVGKTDYIPLLDGDDTSTGDQDVGTALENGGKKAEGAQKPGSKGTAAMQPGRPEPHGEVRPRVDPPDLDSDLVSASMAQSPGPLGSLTGPAQVMDFSPVGSFSGTTVDSLYALNWFMEEGVPLLPAEWPQQHGPMLPEPQPPRGPMNLSPGASLGGLWPDTAPCPPADFPFTASVSTVISRHGSQLASSPDRPSPEGRPPRDSAAYAGGDEKEGEGSDRKQQKKKKKRRPKDEGSWDRPEAQEAPDESPAPADALYQRVGPHRDKAAGGPGEGAWEEQIGKSGGRGKRGKSRKKLPEEWAVTAEPFGPQVPVELGAAAPSLPGLEQPYPGTELDPDPLDLGLFSTTGPWAPQLARGSDLKATAPPFTMPAAAVPPGSSPMSPGPAHPFSATPQGRTGAAFSDEVGTDTSAFSPASQPSPDQRGQAGAWPTAPSDSSWLVGDSSDSFDLGDLPAALGHPLPAGMVLDASGPAPLRCPRTAAQDRRGPPRERQDEAKSNETYRSSSSSSSSSLKSPTFSGPPRDPPPQTAAALASPGSYLNPAAKPFFPGLTEPLEAPAVAPGAAPVMEDSQTPGKSVDKADTKDNQMEDSMERLDEYVQLDEGERRSAKVEKQEQEEQNKPATVKEKEMEKKEPAKEKETDEETQAEKMEDRVEKTPDKPQLVDVAATGAEKAEKAAEGQTEKRMPVSGADRQAVVTQQTKPEETVKVTAMPETTEAGDAEGTEVSEAEPSPETRQTPVALDTGFATPEKHIDTSMEDAKVEQSKAELTSVEDAKVEQTKAELTSVEDFKVEQSKVEQSKAELTLVEDAKVEQSKAEQTKVEVTSVEDAKVEQSKVKVTLVEDAKVEQSKMEVTSVEDAKAEQTKVEVTSVEDAKVEQSKVKVTLVEDAKVEQSKMEVTSVEDAKAEQTKVEVTSVEDAKVEQSKVKVTLVEDAKVEQSKEPVVSIVDKVEKTEEEELTEKPHEQAEPERQEEEMPVGKAVQTKEEAKEEVKKTAERKEVKREEKKEKSGKLDTVTKKPAARPSTGTSALGKEPPSPEKKAKPATTATKLLPATKARPGSAAAAPTRRPASSPTTTTTSPTTTTTSITTTSPTTTTTSITTTTTSITTTSTSISATLAKKTPAAKPASIPTGAPKRAPGLATSRPSSSVTSASTAPREVKPKTTTTTAAERRAPGSKVTTVPATRPTAGPAPNRNGTAARMTAPPRPALSTAAKKPLASKPDSKLGEERKLATLKTASADPPSKPRASSTLNTSATAPAARPGAPRSGPPTTTTTTTERKALVSRAPRPTSTTSTTRTTSTSTSSRPAPRPGTAPGPDVKNARSKVGSMERTKPTGVKVSSASQNKGAASKDPSQGKVHTDSRKLDFSHVTSRLGSKENLKHVPGGGNVQILNKKVDLSKVTSKCGSKDNIKHKPGGGVVKIESHRVNIKDKAQSKVGSMDNLGGTPGKGDGIQEPAEGGSMRAPAVSAEPPEAPASQENGLKEGGPCGTEGLCEAPVLDTRIPETN